MLEDRVENIDLKEFKQYSEFVGSGNFYEEMINLIEESDSQVLHGITDKREYVKELMFTIFFSSNFVRTKEKRIFKSLFPTICSLLEFYKKDDYKFLACQLQRIESYIILDIICKRFSKEYPDALLLTIHDSISTTEDYQDQLYNIMYEELTFHIGVAPSLKKEVWNEENFYKGLKMSRQQVA